MGRAAAEAFAARPLRQLTRHARRRVESVKFRGQLPITAAGIHMYRQCAFHFRRQDVDTPHVARQSTQSRANHGNKGQVTRGEMGTVDATSTVVAASGARTHGGIGRSPRRSFGVIEPPSSEQKVAVITGASRGIGAELVKGYRALGYRVVANSRSIRPAVAAHPVLAVDGDIAAPAVPSGSSARRSRGTDGSIRWSTMPASTSASRSSTIRKPISPRCRRRISPDSSTSRSGRRLACGRPAPAISSTSPPRSRSSRWHRFPRRWRP